MPLPKRGEVWLAELDPVRGHEQAGRRPVLILSTNAMNHGPSGLVYALPLTRTNRRIPFHVRIDPPEAGLHETSYVLCDGLRSISVARLGTHPFGSVSDATLRMVEDSIRILLDL